MDDGFAVGRRQHLAGRLPPPMHSDRKALVTAPDATAGGDIDFLQASGSVQLRHDDQPISTVSPAYQSIGQQMETKYSVI